MAGIGTGANAVDIDCVRSGRQSVSAALIRHGLVRRTIEPILQCPGRVR